MTLRRNPASEGRVDVVSGRAIEGAHLAKHTIHDDGSADAYGADDSDGFHDEASFGTSEIEAELEAAMEYMIASEGMTGVDRIFELVNDVLRRRL